MFGITTPDAIALGMMLIAAVAMLRGSSSGQAAKERRFSQRPWSESLAASSMQISSATM
jgi:hypothetical protein